MLLGHRRPPLKRIILAASTPKGNCCNGKSEIKLTNKIQGSLSWFQIRLMCGICEAQYRTHSSSVKPKIDAAEVDISAEQLAASLFSRRDKVNTKEATIAEVVDHAADLLPHQGILENFVHHNPLEHFQNMTFQEALDKVQKLEEYRSPGLRTLSIAQIDPRERVKESLVDLAAAFLDRGAAKWVPKHRNRGFLYFFASLEDLGLDPPWRRHARSAAREIMKELENKEDPTHICEAILKGNLHFFGIPKSDWEFCIRSMLLELKGWAGMFRRMETHEWEAPLNTSVRLLEFAAVQSILIRSSIMDIAIRSGWDPRTGNLAAWLGKEPTQNKDHNYNHVHTSAIAYVDQSPERREMLEKEFERAVIKAVGNGPISRERSGRPSLQLYTCIDDRECSLRRYVEASNPKEIETFGFAGFFGVPICYEPSDGRDRMILAPEGQRPKECLVEADVSNKANVIKSRRRTIANLALLWEKASFSPFGSIALASFFPISITRLWLMGFAPSWKHEIKAKFNEIVIPKPQTNFQLPMPPEQAASMLAKVFKDIGTHNRFAPIVVILGHGAVSVNNPFAAAYNCGACGGREGGPNARLFARLGNNDQVRACLWKNHNIRVPDDTVFVGGNHNTTIDTIDFYDIDKMTESQKEIFDKAKLIFDNARGQNALERCHRFLLAKNVKTPEQALQHVLQRATDLAEVRPELNHATNAAVILGRRELTKGRFLDRRAFLPAYDPYSDDDQGTNLEHVLAPALIVCSGINLEYLFSTIEVDKHGAGTKAPLNVVGNIAVLQGTTGDLRPGLPTQMTEMHTPVRALFIVDAPIHRVEAVLARREELRHLVRNEWVRFIVRDPETNQFFMQKNGEYFPMSLDDYDFNSPPKPHTGSIVAQLQHAQSVTKKETLYYHTALASMAASCAVPIWMNGGFGATEAIMMNPHGALVAISGTMLSLPVLAFARRYLHGEFMFGRFAGLSVGLVSGFNIVATATSLEQVLAGWSLLGFASTFLIGAYNDRPTVRNNATFAFGAYQISDLAMIVAATFAASHGVDAATVQHPELVASSLLLAAIYKSSQFPLSALFARSMEGPTPASALGYAGLSAHSGVVLLASTMPLWFGFDWARVALGALGLFTAFDSTLVSKIRPDRKGAIAFATSGTIGLIYATLAMGYADAALLMSLGHASFRMSQILRAPNIMTDVQKLKSALGANKVLPREVPDWLYRIAWGLRRVDVDFTLLYTLHRISSYLKMPKDWKPSKIQQYALTAGCVTFAGLPFTPWYYFLEETFTHLLPTHPLVAAGLMATHFTISMALMRFLFLNVLDKNRFHSIQKILPSSKSVEIKK